MIPANCRVVWLVRHGESTANAGARTQEARGYSLTEKGHAESAAFAQSIVEAPELIVVSPYLRAQETANATRLRFPQSPVEEWLVQEVHYLDTAVCVDTTQDERRILARAYWEACDPELIAGFGAESFSMFIGRAAHMLKRLSERPESRILIFTHGQFISAALWLAMTRPSVIDSDAMRRFYSFIHGYAVPNCSVLPLYFFPDGSIAIGPLVPPAGVVVTGSGLAGL